MDLSLWPERWPHEAPDHPVSVTEAHTIMQRHRGCLREECRRKMAAWNALVRAKHITPDSARVSA